MSRTPAAELARLKVTYPGYVIIRGVLQGYRVSDRDSGTWCADALTLPELESALRAHARGKGQQ